MAQDVALWGVAYTDVPEVRVPKQGGGMAAFHDVSDTTAAAADVAQGKLFHAADGTLTEGTASGGGGDDGSFKAVIERRGTVSSLPSNLARIGNYAFNGVTSFGPNFEIPNGVTEIDFHAFDGCTTLALSSLPDGITHIGSYAFNGCTNLAITRLPSELNALDSYAFNNCPNIRVSSIPTGIPVLYSYAFYGCTSSSFSNIADATNLTRIGGSVFYGCTGMSGKVTLPSSVTSIDASAFRGCRNITSIWCDGNITSIGNYIFKAQGTQTTYRMRLTEAHFPNITSSVSLGTVFGDSDSNYGCKLLTLADIGQARQILASAFANCNALTRLVLRKSDSICILANISAFNNTPMRGYNSQTGTVYVPQALIETYKTASNWSTLYNNGTLTFAAIEGSEYELGD